MAEQDRIMVKLKQKTAAYHAKLESLPYFNALIDHELPLACYVNQLRGLSIVHSILEREIATADHEIISQVWHEGLRKLSLLEEDLRFFAPRVISDDKSVVDAALAMTEKFRIRAIENPATLLGCLYVFEGSTLGNQMHRPDVSETFRLDGMNGCRYYASYHDRVKKHWAEFTDRMNTALADPLTHDGVIDAAHETFSGLETLYQALYPLKATQTAVHITRINPEAGNHPMPDDEREIHAALNASQRTWDFFSFFPQCYGDRGKRFSDSDTCWLATLYKFDVPTIVTQVKWLSRYLAGRGMPSIMLEYTLVFLYQDLISAVPEKADTYQPLMDTADVLKTERYGWLDKDTFASLVKDFETDIGPKLSGIHKNTGPLILSALIDEKNGLEGSAGILAQWYTDPESFPGRWIDAVHKTITQVNRLLS